MKEKKNIKDIRREYDFTDLSEKSISEKPIELFEKWINKALNKVKDPTACVLSTVTEDIKPSSRIVLLKEYSKKGFTFFSNFNSRKGRDLAQNNFASLLFYWQEFDRQIRIEGSVCKCSDDTSNKYFEERPIESRIAAIVSKQSEKIVSRENLEADFKTFMDENRKIERPDFWGGYLLKPTKFEFWQGRENRLHDRIVYELIDGKWTIYRLAP